MSAINQRHEVELLWKAYKYEVMWHSQKSYDHIRAMMKAHDAYNEVQDAISDALSIQPSQSSIINAFCHIWGYFKKFCRDSDIALFKKLKAQYEQGRIDEDTLIFFLYCMTMFYDVTYLKTSTLIQKCSIANG